MTDEEAMEALLNSDGYSFPTWTLKLGLPTDEMRLVMSLIASDKAPIPVDVAYISEYLHMDGAVVESSVKELLDRRLVYKKDSYLIFALNVKSAERSFLMRKSIPLPQGKNKIGGAYSFFRYVPSGAFSLDFTVPRATYYGIL